MLDPLIRDLLERAGREAWTLPRVVAAFYALPTPASHVALTMTLNALGRELERQRRMRFDMTPAAPGGTARP